MTLGVPVKVLHEAEGHTVTVESATGELYRGVLIEAEDNMNMQVKKLVNFAHPPKLRKRNSSGLNADSSV